MAALKLIRGLSVEDKPVVEEVDDRFTHPCGASTSISPRYDMIPSRALRRLAARYEMGAEKHGEDNWRQGIGDLDYVLQRLSHLIGHALALRDELKGYEPVGREDHAAACLWNSAFLCEAWEPPVKADSKVIDLKAEPPLLQKALMGSRPKLIKEGEEE